MAVIYKHGPVAYISMKNTSSDTTINAGEFVKLDQTGHGVLPAGDGDTMFGIAHEDIAPGEVGEIEVPCGAVYAVDAASGADLSMGDDVYLASATTVDAGSAGNVSAGKVVGYDPSAGGRVWAALVSSLFHKVTHS